MGIMPLPNDFCGDGQARAGYAPLKVLFCPRCTLTQLSVVVDPAILYRNYAYVTSKSAMMQEHFHALLKTIREEQAVGKVLEIGSNDGALLSFLREQGATQVFGVDPALNLALLAEKDNISMHCDAWSHPAALNARHRFSGPADIIIARHVFCHADDWHDFINNMSLVAQINTLVCIEVPHVTSLIANGEFDTIYHEHTSYFTVRAMQAVLNDSGWRMQRIVHFPIHGGVVFVMIRRHDFPGDPHPSVQEHLDGESHITADLWKDSGDAFHSKIISLREIVKQFRLQKKRVVGYGASAKSSIWINACKFTRKDIECVYDSTPQKWYKFIPGTDIPVAHEGAFYVDNPDAAINFSWNYRTEIEKKQQKWHDGGGKWIVPVPYVEVC